MMEVKHCTMNNMNGGTQLPTKFFPVEHYY